MKRLPWLVLLLLILWPGRTLAEDIFLPQAGLATLHGDERILFAVDDDGGVWRYDEEESALDGPVAVIDLETDFPVAMDGEIWIYHKPDETLRCLWPGDEERPLPLPGGLTHGNEEGSLSALQVRDHVLYFLYFDGGSDTPILARCDLEGGAWAWVKIEGLTGYGVENGTAYALLRTRDETILCAVDWQGGGHQEIARLPGRFTAFGAMDGRFFAAQPEAARFVMIEDGKIALKIHSPYAAGTWEGVAAMGRYWVCGSNGLYAPRLTEGKESVQVLRILKSGGDAIDQQFLLLHPNVKLEYIPSTAYETTDLCEAIITGVIEYDVAELSTVDAAADAFLKKGYAFDLSTSPVLLEMAQRLYPSIRAVAFDGEKLQIMPCSVTYRNLYRYDREALARAGLTAADLPSTMGGLMDFIVDWFQSHGEEDLVPILPEEDSHSSFLYMALNAYIAHARRTGIDLDFDTPEFRALLTQVKAAAEVSPVHTEYYQPPCLLYAGGARVPSVDTVVFPLAEDEAPRYEGQLSGYVIDPRTKEPDLALSYVEWRMQNLDEVVGILLFDGEYQALERADFAYFLGQWEAQKARLEAQLVSEESAPARREIQTQLDAVNDQIANPPAGLRYLITQEEIDFYQRKIIPLSEFPFANGITTSANSSQWAKTLIRLYLGGQVSQEDFIQQLSHRVRMMQLED